MQKSILLVDKNTLSSNQISKLLGEKYKVFCSNNHTEALSVVGNVDNDISLVLLNLSSFCNEGLQIFEQIKQSEVAHSLPFVLLADVSDRDALLSATRMGIADYILLPFSEQSLLRIDLLLESIDEQRKIRRPCLCIFKNRCKARNGRVIDRIKGRGRSDKVKERSQNQDDVRANRSQNLSQLQSILSNINSAVSATQTDSQGNTRYIFVNEQYLKMINCPKEQFLTGDVTLRSLTHPDDLQMVMDGIKRASETNLDERLQFRIITPDGKTHHIQSDLSSARFFDEPLPVLVVVSRDVTSDVKAQNEISEHNQLLDAIMENVGCGIAAFVRNGTKFETLFANEKQHILYGYSKEELEQRLADGVDNVVVEQDKKAVMRAAKLTEKSDKPVHHEFRIKSQDGSHIWIKATSTCCRMKNIDKPVHIVFSYDITEDKEKEIKITQLGENLQKILNDMPCSYVRLKALPDGRFVTDYVNDNFCVLRGMSRQEIMSIKQPDVAGTIHPDDREAMIEILRGVVSEGVVKRGSYRLKRGNSSYISVNAYGYSSRNAKGEIFINVYYVNPFEEERLEGMLKGSLSSVLSAITKFSSDMVFAKDKELKYICCSPAFATFAKCKSTKDIIGKTDFDLFDKKLADMFRKTDLALLETGNPLIDIIQPMGDISGASHYSSTSKYLLKDATGVTIGLYGVSRDITLARNSFEHLKLLTDSIPGGIASYTHTAKNGFRLSYFNYGLCRMLGYTHTEFEENMQEGMFRCMLEEDVPQVNLQMRELIESGKPVNVTYRLKDKEGIQHRWVYMRGTIYERVEDISYINLVFLDITDQKNAELQAYINGEEFKVAMSQMGKMICVYDIATRTLTSSENYSMMYGLPQILCNVPQVLFDNNIVHPDSIETCRNFYRSIIKGDERGKAEYCVFKKDGTKQWVSSEFSLICDYDGTPVKAIISREDVTQRRLDYELEKNKPSLGEDNLLVHALFNLNNGETLDYAYADGTEVPIDERTAFTYGNNLENIIPDDNERCRYIELNDSKNLLKLHEAGEKELSIDYRRRLKSGDVIWVRNLLRMLKQPTGEDILLFEYCYNIEEEKTRDLLQEAIIYENYDFVIRVDGKKSSYIMVAKMGEKEAIPPKEKDSFEIATSFVIDKYVHPEDKEHVKQFVSIKGMKENLRNKEKCEIVYRVVIDEKIRYKKNKVFYLDRDREIFIVTREDISDFMFEEKNKSDQLMNALTAANEANMAKSSFLSRISHELRTPMNAILGLASLSLSEADNPKIIRENINKISVSAQYLLSLINDILQMSRIESGRMVLSHELFDIEKLLFEVNTIIHIQSRVKDIEYEAIVKGLIYPQYIGDITKLQEILVNVLGNAVKFTNPGGKVIFTIQQLRCVENKSTLRFVISDTGIGIDEEFLPNIFEPFAQESSTLSSSTSGTGLGLSITQKLTQMMNGSVQVQSQKGVGTVFTIDVQLEVPPDSVLANVNDIGKNASVLVVDGNLQVCEAAKIIFDKLVVDCNYATSLPQAVQYAKQNTSENLVVFYDWKIAYDEDSDGASTLKEAANGNCYIVMTVYDVGEVQKEAGQADLVIEKPLSNLSVRKVFDALFGSKQTFTNLQKSKRNYDLRGRRILVAEDNELNVEIARRLLQKQGATVVVASNGLEAVKTFSSSPDFYFDLIIMDIRMPIMDGLEATKKIRASNKGDSKTIPIIAMTANAFDEDVELSIASGINAHLAKPIDPHLMFETIERYISGKK